MLFYVENLILIYSNMPFYTSVVPLKFFIASKVLTKHTAVILLVSHLFIQY